MRKIETSFIPQRLASCYCVMRFMSHRKSHKMDLHSSAVTLQQIKSLVKCTGQTSLKQTRLCQNILSPPQFPG